MLCIFNGDLGPQGFEYVPDRLRSKTIGCLIKHEFGHFVLEDLACQPFDTRWVQPYQTRQPPFQL